MLADFLDELPVRMVPALIGLVMGSVITWVIAHWRRIRSVITGHKSSYFCRTVATMVASMEALYSPRQNVQVII